MEKSSDSQNQKKISLIRFWAARNYVVLDKLLKQLSFIDDLVQSPSSLQGKNHPSSSFQVLFQCLLSFIGLENWAKCSQFPMGHFLTTHSKYLQLGLITDVLYCKLHDVCDVQTFETLCFAKLLLRKNLFIPKRSLRENFKLLLIINNSSHLFYSPSLLCKYQKRIFCNMKS